MTETAWIALLALGVLIVMSTVGYVAWRLIKLESRRQKMEAAVGTRLTRVASAEHARRERKDGLRLSETSLETGTRILELAQRALSDTTFTLIDKFARDADFKLGSQEAKAGYDRRTEAFYEGMRKTNRVVHVAADLLINRRTLFQRRSRSDAQTKRLASNDNNHQDTQR